MTDRANNNSTSYEHPEESNLLNLHKAMEYNGDGEPLLRVSVGGESVTISGDVTIPGSVEINNDEGNPIPAHVHLFGDDGVEYSDSNPLMTKLDATTLAALESVDLNPATLAALETTELGATTLAALETTELGATTLAALENITVTQGTNPWMTRLDFTTLSALESVDLNPATLAALESVDLNPATLAALESVDLNPATLAALENVTVDAVTANVTVQGEVTLGASTLSALETTTVLQGTNPWIVDGEVALDTATLAALETTELGSTTLAALENVTVDAVTSNVTVQGEVTLGASTLTALENVTVDSVTANVTVQGEVTLGATTLAALETTELGTATLTALETTELGATTLAALETTELGTTTLAALENVTVDAVTSNVTVDGTVGLDAEALSALENISIDAGDITVGGEIALDSATLAALENVTVDEVVATVNTDPSTHLFDLAAGTISGQESVTQAGRNDTISVEIETVWDGAGLYPYLTASSQVYVTSTADQDEQDSPIGKGARSVQITGLDSSYNEVTEEVLLDDNNSVTRFLRIHEVRVKTVGESGSALGEISVRTQPMRGGTLLAQVSTVGGGIGSSLGKSFMAVYTVPAGKTAYLQQLSGGSSRGSDTSLYIVSKTFGEDVFISQDIAISSGAGFGKEYKVPLRFTEKTDIEIRAVSNNEDSIGNECSASFNLVLVDNA